ncbi:MAG: hypothetical protein FWD27_08100 [Coriobacteriia bacterium]|nr:hypothetical protein [Coriobacteriia bacterium]
MKTKQLSLLAVLVCAFCLLGALGLAGCTSGGNDGNDGEAMNSETATATVVEISSDELLVDVSTSSATYLQGLARIGIDQIDANIIDSLAVGDTVKFEFAGFMGMSEPPFIPATALEVVR